MEVCIVAASHLFNLNGFVCCVFMMLPAHQPDCCFFLRRAEMVEVEPDNDMNEFFSLLLLCSHISFFMVIHNNYKFVRVVCEVYVESR